MRRISDSTQHGHPCCTFQHYANATRDSLPIRLGVNWILGCVSQQSIEFLPSLWEGDTVDYTNQVLGTLLRTGS
jgi:hypothetical protein